MKRNKSILAKTVFMISCGLPSISMADVVVGSDLNSSKGENSAINALYSGNRGSKGGGDQSLQSGDVVYGTNSDDVLIGGLGIDVLFAKEGNDILIGGTEDFNPLNRDRAFGGAGDDIFIWAPGDGNDFFDGGEGTDVLMMALIGEKSSDSNITTPVFSVNPPNKEGSQDFDGILLNDNNLPFVRVKGPGFCEVLGQNSSKGNSPTLADLNLDHLVRFSLKGVANNFDNTLLSNPDADVSQLDTGLRIAVHLKNTEFVVCDSRQGDAIEVFDLRSTPIEKVGLDQLPAKVQTLIANDATESSKQHIRYKISY